MKIHRFFINSISFRKEEKTLILTDKEIIHQISKVLKLKPGEQLALCNGQNSEVVCILESVNKKELILKVLDYCDLPKKDRQTVLYLAILKRENFELAVQKSAEIGIDKLVPIITDRTIKTGINLERLNKISKEACELSGRGTGMFVEPAIKFKEAIVKAKENETNLFLVPGGAEFCPGKTIDNKIKSVGLFVGPEGGWSDEEIFMAKENNFKIVGIGKNILRGETAATIVSFLAVNY